MGTEPMGIMAPIGARVALSCLIHSIRYGP